MRKEDLPKDIQDLVLKEMYSTPKYMNLVATYQYHKMKGNMMQAMMVQKMMKQVEDNVFKEYFKETEKTRIFMSDIITSMDKEDQLAMNSYANGIMLISDVLDNIIVEMNQLVKKYKQDMRITAFDELNALSKEAKRNVYSFDLSVKDDFASTLFGNTADNLLRW